MSFAPDEKIMFSSLMSPISQLPDESEMFAGFRGTTLSLISLLRILECLQFLWFSLPKSPVPTLLPAAMFNLFPRFADHYAQS